MAKVSISEAARLAGVSRSHLYASFINTGKISVETIEDATGKPQKQIDTSELQRVFGNLKPKTEDSARTGQSRTSADTIEDSEDTGQDSRTIAVLSERVHGLEALLTAKSEALEQSQAECVRLLGIVEQQTRLLTHQTAPAAASRGRNWTPWALMVLLTAILAYVVIMQFQLVESEPAPDTKPTPSEQPSPRHYWQPEDTT